MKRKLRSITICIVAAVLLFTGCSSKDEKPGAPAAKMNSPGQAPMSAASPAAVKGPARATDVIIEVDNAKYTRGELDADVNARLESAKKKIETGREQEAKASLRAQMINDFIVRTLLANEVKRLQVKVSEQEVSQGFERLRSSLPPGNTLDDLMKKNGTTVEKMRQEIGFGIKVNKLVMNQLAGKSKPMEKEIYAFYEKHKDQFKTGESVHVRHILVAVSKNDTDKQKTEKKERAEMLRKQLAEGADFAETARKNSDCPSKQGGGDLGVLYRGQAVKPFEEAAFSQPLRIIGPVVKTEYGYHIIQVLEHNAPKQVPLDSKIRADIASFIEQQKKQEAFEALLKKLRAQASILIHDTH